MVQLTLEELWQRFEADFPDLYIAQGECFSYLKLFQHASSYHALGDKRKLIPRTIDRTAALLPLKQAVKHTLKRPKAPAMREVVLLDDKRTVDTPEGRKSYYFHHIVNELGANKLTVVNDSHKNTALPVSVDKPTLDALGSCALDSIDRRVLRDLLAVLKRAKNALRSQPLLYDYLASAFTVFFADFHRFHHLFKGKGVRHFFLTTHYHREGLIAAAKMNGVTVTEFQHGLIAREDLYYAYPPFVCGFTENALFADRICVFGEYWKRVLVSGEGYPEDAVIVLGDYSLRAEGVARYKGIDKVNALLVTAQKNCVDEYLNYVTGVMELFNERYADWELWVKLHPLERKPEAYEVLKNHPQCRVFGKESDLMHLLAQCKVQVSIYSTTLFDALGLDVVNLSIQNYGRSADYARAMVSERVALGVRSDEDPIAAAHSAESGKLLPEFEVYAPFAREMAHRLLDTLM